MNSTAKTKEVAGQELELMPRDEMLPVETRTDESGQSEMAAIMTVIERIAVNPDADISKLEKMMDMQERIMDRNARMEFDAALATMQAELPEVEKVAQGHNSKYAKFDQILSAIKPSLKAHGFSITHRVKVEDQLIHVTAILSHRGGHREETTLVLPPDTTGSKNAVQAVGSTTEYGRRYTMNSLLGIATKDADMDGGKPQDLTGKAADWIAKIQECADMASLQKEYTAAFKDLNGDGFGRQKLNNVKDAKKKELSNGAA